MSHLLSFPEIELVSSSAADTVACYTAPATGVACEYDYSAMAVIEIAVLFISPAASSTPFSVVETSISKSHMSFSKVVPARYLRILRLFFLCHLIIFDHILLWRLEPFLPISPISSLCYWLSILIILSPPANGFIVVLIVIIRFAIPLSITHSKPILISMVKPIHSSINLKVRSAVASF